MFKRLVELLKQALRDMVSYKSIADTVDVSMFTISDEMSDAIELWRDMYKEKAPWLNEDDGVYSLGIPKTVCQELASYVLSEMESHIVAPGQEDIDHDESKSANVSTKAGYMDDLYHKRLIDKLYDKLEKGMAMGGMLIKPYMSNGSLYFDFTYQGDFYPITFDDDGNITDIAFPDQFVEGEYLYTKVERHTFANNTVVVENKAYKAKLRDKDDDKDQDIGTEIPLTSVSKWANIEPEVTINNVEKPLYGYYKVPIANNVDMDSPLGVSVFHPAVKLIERTDKQFSRLDWEYEGGQLAIDVDPNAVTFQSGYFGQVMEMDDCKKRLYRGIDLGQDNTYEAFAPTLRDTNYQAGLTKYLTKIEDTCGLSRGALSEVESEARTATEIKVLKQRQFRTVCNNQAALEKALNDAIYAMSVYIDLYNLAPQGDYTTTTEWKDSILTDTDTELEQKLNLEKEGILSKAEVRAWYTGESEEEAQLKIDEMEKKEQEKQLNDLFSMQPNDVTLEQDTDTTKKQTTTDDDEEEDDK